MSFEWREFSLGDLITIKHGFAFSGEHISKNQGKCVLVTPGNFEIGGGFKEGNAKYFHGEYTQEYIFASGDLVVTMTDLSKTADTLGYSAKIPREKGKIYLHNQRVGKVCSKSTEAELDYLFWVMRHRDYRSWVVSTATGSTVKHTSPSRILEYSFQLPPLGEQKAIAHILGTLDDKIELNRKTNETLEAMAKALFQSWFVDFDPVRAKAAGRPTGLPDEISNLFPDSFEESELGEIPRGWQCCTFTQLVDVISGGTPKTSIDDYWNGVIPWFSVVDAPAGPDSWVIQTEKSITPVGLDNCSSKLLQVGTTIISARGTVGKVCLVGQEMAMNQSCYGLRSKSAGGDYFCFYLTKSLVEILGARAHGSVFSTITRDTLDGVSTICPPLRAIRAFSDIAGGFLGKIKANLNESLVLRSQRDTLLPKLISGELRIPEAEKLLEQAGV